MHPGLQVHQEVAELYRKAIKKCQQITVEAGDDMWCSCKDRLATLEYNLAELHISFYREQVRVVELRDPVKLPVSTVSPVGLLSSDGVGMRVCVCVCVCVCLCVALTLW